MPMMSRSSFSKGWTPDADSVNAPPDALLRADNLILDELGVVALRAGSVRINGSALADIDVHSLYTAELNGTRYRMYGAGQQIYANGVSLAQTFNTDTSKDVSFGSYLGQIFIGRGTNKKKYDGTTVRNWGISMTGTAPTVDSASAVGAGEILSGDSTEAPAVTMIEDDGTGPTYSTGHSGVANGSVVLKVNTSTNRGEIEKDFGVDTDFNTGFDDNSYLAAWVFVTDPAQVFSVSIRIDVNNSLFDTDYYIHTFFNDPDNPSTFNFPTAGWNLVSVRRGDIYRVGATAGKDWATVNAIRVQTQANTNGASALTKYDAIGMAVGSGEAAAVSSQWRYVYVRNNSTYIAKSAPSAASAAADFSDAGVTVTVPSDASRDSQINEIWVYRFNDNLGGWYRTAVKTGVSGTGSFTIGDAVSDASALIINIRLEEDNAGPPDNMLDIEGPYYDRIFVLTATTLYPSRRLSPDTFSAGQAIIVGGAEESCLWVKKALGGLYIGTTKDIYRLDGTGAELPDGSTEFTLTNVNIDNPPRQIGSVAQEGNLLVYMAADGWRAMSGTGSKLLNGGTDSLYKGKARHGVSAVNLATGRFRAAIAQGQLSAITPEGASTTSSQVLYRLQFSRENWYRFTWATPNWRAIHKEPDGTLIASDNAGFVWTLDTGTQDNASNIPIVMWTKVDDDDKPFQRKDPWDIRIKANTGNVAATVAVHLDGAAGAAVSPTVTANGMTVTLSDLSAIAIFRQIQLRVTGSLPSFQWYDHGVGYREHPPIQVFAENKPEQQSPSRRRFSGLEIVADTLSGDATVTPMLDGVAQATFTVNTSAPVTTVLKFTTDVAGKDLWAKVSKATGFELYKVEPIIAQTLPVLTAYFENRPKMPSPSRRRFGGVKLVIDTLSAAATVTPMLDGTAQTAQSVTTTEPKGQTLTFNTVVGRDLWTRISKATGFELYEFEPIIVEELPTPIKGATPTNDGGYPGVKTLSGVQLRACTLGVAVTVGVILDGIVVESFPVTSGLNDPDEFTLAFTTARQATNIALTFSANAEVHTWAPLITANRPLGIKSWDSGPLDLGTGEFIWPREVWMKVEAGANLSVSCIFDGVSFATVSVPISDSQLNVASKIRVPIPRDYKGRVPRFRISSASAFFPYWIEFVDRQTRGKLEKEPIRVPALVGGKVVV